MDMLAHDVRRRAHLKVVLRVHARHKVRDVKSDAVVRVGAEEKRLRRFNAILSRLHIGPQCRDTRLREMPRGFVEFDVELNVRALVKTRDAGGSASIAYTRIGKWSACNFRTT